MLAASLHRIRTSEVHRVHVPIHVPFTISRESLARADILIVTIKDSEGLVGLGECAPFPSLTYDSLESAERVARDLLTKIQGLTLDEAFAKMRELKPAVTQESITGFVGVECALWDLSARSQEKPMAALFGSIPKRQIKTDITLPIMRGESIADFWRLYASYDFSAIKVKVSGQVEADLSMLKALKSEVPASLNYILDGNQGFELATALKLVDEAQALGLDILFFEQPLPEKNHAEFLELSKSLAVPICLDETIRTPSDLDRILEAGMRPIVNIKIMKSGLDDVRQIISRAQSAGCLLMIGGMLESEIAMNVSLHIACGTGAIDYADLDTPFFFKQRLTLDSPWHPHQAELYLGGPLTLGG